MTLTLISANVTSWNSVSERVKYWRADILLLQESRLDLSGQRRASNKCREMGFEAHFGIPCRVQLFYKKKKMCRRVMQGGVINIDRNDIKQLPSRKWWKAARDLYMSGRHLRTGIVQPNSGENFTIHFGNAYMYAGMHGKVDRTNREDKLRKMFEDGEALGDQPVYLCVDTNSIIEQSLEIQSDWTQEGGMIWASSMPL